VADILDAQPFRILQGDALAVLRTLPSESVHCCVTSPPYWGLRDYGVAGQIGLEGTPDEFVARIVDAFREVRRVLREDGTLWLNLGDSYATRWGSRRETGRAGLGDEARERSGAVPEGLKEKDLVGIPWLVAQALRAPYYTGTIRDERDRIWLAAMLDAEGCMFIHKRKAGQSNGQGYQRQSDSYGPGVEIANTSLAVVERIMALVGKGSICSQGPEQTDGRRKQTIYRWNLRTAECRDFVRELYPYLVAKQQQARILIGCPSSGERAEAAHAALKLLHRTGSSDVDFPAPPSMFEPGYYLRSDIIWSKLNPMPESVTDRPTKAHEYLFLLSKSPTYFYDAEAIREPITAAKGNARSFRGGGSYTGGNSFVNSAAKPRETHGNEASATGLRNRRSVWTIGTQPFPEAHFATFPPALVEPCIKAGTSEHGVCSACGAPWERVVGDKVEVEGPRSGNKQRSIADGSEGDRPGDHLGRGVPWAPSVTPTVGWRQSCKCAGGGVNPAVVLDPFSGAGTTALVATRLRRRAIGIELNPDYVAMSERRIRGDAPLFMGVA